MTEVRLLEADKEHENIYKNMLSLFLHDLSRYSDDLQMNQDTGMFDFNGFELLFREKELKPLLIMASERIVGLLLLTSGGYSGPDHDYEVNSLFILQSERRRGWAMQACEVLFSKFPGSYKVAQLKSNGPAVTFWSTLYQRLDLHVNRYTATEDGQQVEVQQFCTGSCGDFADLFDQ
ncbi:hypothetical protein Q5741_05965 [Paenibacillus sp. JX-17]|uniref:GNAT family N-acetyltransferase n=1 Tax=Paenibacillus lacisoli TaxID=3064525 RepID=A0ABT9CBD0_9BACL|nr:hypothetical protein [Paenibacillus sp. JX-17]MDO7905964.1 hypothetical protein [Paenibacillus sp. JX-17]